MLAIYRISLIVTFYTTFFILAWTCPLKTPWLALKLSTLSDLKWYSPRETVLFSFSKKESREAIATAPPSCFMCVCLELKIWLPWKRDVTALELYSYGTRTATCICYSYGSQKISRDFSVIPDPRLSKLLYLPLEGLSESSECPFFEPDKFACSLLTKRTTHSRHLELFCAILTHMSRD